MTDERVRILLADSQEIVRAGLRTMLEAHANWFVCGEASDGRHAVRLASEAAPDVAILDLEMKPLDGIETTRRIKMQRPGTEVVIFTTHEDEFKIPEALAAGARAFIFKSDGARRLIEAVECASRHIPFSVPRAEEPPRKHNNSPRLTKRQVEIVRLVATGASNKDVAEFLGISIKTVETHRAAVMRRLGFSSIANLVRYAVRERVIKA